MTLVAVAVALAAALAFGWSTAAMHHGASTAPPELHGAVALLRHLVGQWRWLTGMAASLVGLALHTFALRIGSIALVQPLVVSGLVFAFAFRAALDRRLPSVRVSTWAVVVAVGLTVFLLAASSTSTSTAASGRAATVLLVAGAGLSLLCFWASGRVAPHSAGLLLGASSGVVFGLIAGTLKAATAADSLRQLVTSWPLYVLIPLGVAGFLLNQTAYRAAPLSSSLPVLNVINPLVALLFGVVAFHETPSGRAASVLQELGGLSVVLLGIFFLARHDADLDARGQPRATVPG